jgi:hypothetical protein
MISWRSQPRGAMLARPPSSKEIDMSQNQETVQPQKIGKYLVSPLIKTMGDGWFASSVSIRSGSGSCTTDRVLRLTRLFRCATEAARFAHAEAVNWIRTSPGLSAA